MPIAKQIGVYEGRKGHTEIFLGYCPNCKEKHYARVEDARLLVRLFTDEIHKQNAIKRGLEYLKSIRIEVKRGY